MLVVYHLRNVELERVRAAIEQQLRSEGFVVASPAEDAEGESVPLWLQSPRTAIRKVTIYGENGWVGFADESFSRTAWGPRLSRGLDVPVIRLAGECDHAFFSDAILFEAGEQVAASVVPKDAVLEDDGRYRIRPTFLAAIAPEALEALERGVVVQKLGGEENVNAVGEALGVPRPCVFRSDSSDGDLVLRYRYAGPDAALGSPFGIEHSLDNETDPLRSKAKLAAFGVDVPDELAGDPMLSFLSSALTSDFAGSGWSVVSSEVRESEDEGNAISVLVNGGGTRIGEPVGFTADVALGFGDHDEVHGLVVEVSGPGLELFDVEELRAARAFSEAPEDQLVAIAEREGDSLVFRFPDLHLERPRSEPEVVDPASMKVGAHVVAKRAGEGELRLAFRTLEPPSLRVEHMTLSIEEPVRVPVLPDWAEHPAPHGLEAYAMRAALVGWMAWEGAWPDIAARVEAIVSDITTSALAITKDSQTTNAKGFEATVLRRGGESLTFKAPVCPSSTDRTWTKIRKELARGADVKLSIASRRTDTQGFEAAVITLAHQPHGTNYSDDDGLDRGDLGLPPVVVTFFVPRPDRETDRRSLGSLARSALERAGAIEGSLGGFAVAGCGPLLMSTAFEDILDLNLYDERDWLRTHLRTPGWAVLAPKQAKLGTPPGSRIDLTPLAHGTLLSATMNDPFAMTDDDLEAMERFVIPALGSPAEVSAFDAGRSHFIQRPGNE